MCLAAAKQASWHKSVAKKASDTVVDTVVDGGRDNYQDSFRAFPRRKSVMSLHNSCGSVVVTVFVRVNLTVAVAKRRR